MKDNIFLVNAFTTKQFAGNPAMICIFDQPKDTEFMQQLAQELNQPITAFVYPKNPNEYNLNWFTPTTELNLCGHGTLAAAYILWEQGYLPQTEQIHFQTKGGLLTVTQTDAGIQLDFPANVSGEKEAPSELINALNVPFKQVERNQLGYIVELENEEMVKNLKPKFELLRSIPVTGVMVTSHSSSSEFDFISRYFAPNIGIDEDSVTGSAHCGLAPYWGKRLKKNEMTAYQASKRGGTVRIKLVNNRVLLSGQALILFQGKMNSNNVL